MNPATLNARIAAAEAELAEAYAERDDAVLRAVGVLTGARSVRAVAKEFGISPSRVQAIKKRAAAT